MKKLFNTYNSMLSKYIWKLKRENISDTIGYIKKEEENQRKKLQSLYGGKTGNPRA